MAEDLWGAVSDFLGDAPAPTDLNSFPAQTGFKLFRETPLPDLTVPVLDVNILPSGVKQDHELTNRTMQVFARWKFVTYGTAYSGIPFAKVVTDTTGKENTVGNSTTVSWGINMADAISVGMEKMNFSSFTTSEQTSISNEYRIEVPSGESGISAIWSERELQIIYTATITAVTTLKLLFWDKTERTQITRYPATLFVAQPRPPEPQVETFPARDASAATMR